MGALGCGNPIGFILGSVASGLAAKYYSWRASFVVVAIFFVIMTVASLWTMPSIPRTGSLSVEARQFDYLGTVLTIVGFALVSAALTCVSNDLPSADAKLLTASQCRARDRLDFPPGRHDAPLWCFLPRQLRDVGEPLPVSASKPHSVEEQNFHPLRPLRFLRIYVVHDQPVLDFAIHARSTASITTPHCYPFIAASSRWFHMELYRASFSLENCRESSNGNWWLCLFSWSDSPDLRQAGHELLATSISSAVYHCHRRRLPVHCVKCRSSLTHGCC
jgi:Major Facilitator Superfamily